MTVLLRDAILPWGTMSQPGTWLWLWGWVSLSADADSCHYTAWWTMLFISLFFIIQYLFIIGTDFYYFFFLQAEKEISTEWTTPSL